MKKNVVGHMMAAKEPVKARLRRWDLLPRLICLLLALLIWLLIVNLNTKDNRESNERSSATIETQV